MDDTISCKCKGILLLQEMVRLIWASSLGIEGPYKDGNEEIGDEKEQEEKAKDLCLRLHQHLMEQATIPGNQIIDGYLDSRDRTVRERLDRQAKDLETVLSGKMLGMVALGNFRVDISHNDGIKQLLVCGGPFADDIDDIAKMVGFALKLTSSSAYDDPEESLWYSAKDAWVFLKHVASAQSYHDLEWSPGSRPAKS